jgi:hypothetical protein
MQSAIALGAVRNGGRTTGDPMLPCHSLRTCDTLVAGGEGVSGEVREELLTLLTKSLGTVLCPARLPQHL